MNSILIYIISIFIILLPGQSQGQQLSETITREYEAVKVLYLANVSGNVNVEGYSGNKILLEAKKELDSDRSDDLEKLKKEIVISEIKKEDTLIIYIKGIGNCFCAEDINYGWDSRYRYNFDNWNNDFDYNFDFIVRVPENTNLNLSTINNGDVSVHSTLGALNIKNVNGGIFLTEVSGTTRARTINGDVIIDYSGIPKGDSRYYSLNGDIKVNFNDPLNAVMSFKSFNGEIFTNIDDLEYLPMKIQKSEAEKGKGISYKIGGRTEIKIRKGGLYLDFETFNGNVIVKEI